MAIPAAVGGWGGGGVKQTGIKLVLYPSTQRAIPIELQQSTGSTLASSQWTSVFLPPSTRGSNLQYTAALPLSTKRYYFRARHTGGGFSAGAFTPTVSARPVVIPDYSLPITINAAGNLEVVGANVIISSGNRPTVGSQNTASYLTKTVRYSADIFAPAINTFKYSRGVGTLVIGSTGSSAFFNADIPLAKGVTITQVAYRGGRRKTTGQISKIELYRISTAGIGTLVTTLTMTTGSTAQATITSSALSVAVSSAQNVIARAYLKSTTAVNQPAIVNMDVTYRMPDYGVTI